MRPLSPIHPVLAQLPSIHNDDWDAEDFWITRDFTQDQMLRIDGLTFASPTIVRTDACGCRLVSVYVYWQPALGQAPRASVTAPLLTCLAQLHNIENVDTLMPQWLASKRPNAKTVALSLVVIPHTDGSLETPLADDEARQIALLMVSHALFYLHPVGCETLEA
jgi:hypothetical protein